jgi:hypothetical protein
MEGPADGRVGGVTRLAAFVDAITAFVEASTTFVETSAAKPQGAHSKSKTAHPGRKMLLQVVIRVMTGEVSFTVLSSRFQ